MPVRTWLKSTRNGTLAFAKHLRKTRSQSRDWSRVHNRAENVD